MKPCDYPCQKCESTDIYRRFETDHLHHHCRCCGYAWDTPTADHQEIDRDTIMRRLRDMEKQR